MYGRKGQFQINETIIVLFLFSIIVLIGLFAFFRYTNNVIENDFREYETEKFETLFYTSVDSSIKCSDRSVCVDGIKLLFFEPKGYSLKLTQVYPDPKFDAQCTEKNYPECDSYVLGSERVEARKLSTPILVYDPVRDRYLGYSMEISR